MKAVGRYDTALQMFVEEPRDPDLRRLTFLRWLVDDAAFADMWVRSRHAGRGLSRAALGRELRDKGVDDETARAALEGIDPDAEVAAATVLVAKRLSASRGLAFEVRLRRLTGMLARKGYPGGMAMRVVRDAIAEERATEVDA